MPKIEVYDEANEASPMLFEGSFDFVPRIGETIAKDAGGYFVYYEVVRIWHREGADVQDVWQGAPSGSFKTCLAVRLDH